MHMSAFDPKRTFDRAKPASAIRKKYELVIGRLAPTRTRLLSGMRSVTEYRVVPRPQNFKPTPTPLAQRPCPNCGVPMLLTLIELTEQVDDDQRTFECWTCSYSETVVVAFR